FHDASLRARSVRRIRIRLRAHAEEVASSVPSRNPTDGIFGPAALKPTGRADSSNVPSACTRCKPTNGPGRSAVDAPVGRRCPDACRYGNEAGDVMTIPADGAFEQHLGRNAANHVALTPLGFLQRTARVFPERLSVVHGSRRYTWRQTSERCHR